ncbi:MAG: thiamine pyrophosphate-dependent dehydrogenase E1 component subunit alpha [Candidatus Acidiferrales bacterium]
MEQTLTREQQLELLYFMRLNRALEERLERLVRQNQVVGGLYLSRGQEAISVGSAYALEPGDWIAPMVRNIGALLVRGFRPRDILTQNMARANSPTHGRDSASHFGDLGARHVVSPISMLGDLIPVMTGVAMGARILGQKRVAMTWIGDGGSSTGAFHEGLNFAAVQRAPLVLVIENNQWAYSTPVARQTPLRDLADRARAYGIASTIVDGNDVLAVYRAAKQAADRARAGQGPVLIEAKTMRMRGHAQHDPAEYVPKKMLEYWKARDPIARCERVLTARGVLTERVASALTARIERELADDVAFAEASPLPSEEEANAVAQGVYCDGCHEIAPDWQRPKDELLPPKSATEAHWTVRDFGAFEEKASLHVAPKTAAKRPVPAAKAKSSAKRAPRPKAAKISKVAKVRRARG